MFHRNKKKVKWVWKDVMVSKLLNYYSLFTVYKHTYVCLTISVSSSHKLRVYFYPVPRIFNLLTRRVCVCVCLFSAIMGSLRTESAHGLQSHTPHKARNGSFWWPVMCLAWSWRCPTGTELLRTTRTSQKLKPLMRCWLRTIKQQWWPSAPPQRDWGRFRHVGFGSLSQDNWCRFSETVLWLVRVSCASSIKMDWSSLRELIVALFVAVETHKH